MPECAQVCALHTRPHLTTLKKTNGKRLSCSRRNPQNWYCVTQFLAHPVPVSDGSIHMRQLDRGGIKLFPYAAYMRLFLIVSEIYGRKVSKWWKTRNFFELFGPPCRNALADLDGSTPECGQVCALHTEPHLEALRKIEMVAVHCTSEITPIFRVFYSPSTCPPQGPMEWWTPEGDGARRQTLSLHK